MTYSDALAELVGYPEGVIHHCATPEKTLTLRDGVAAYDRDKTEKYADGVPTDNWHFYPF